MQRICCLIFVCIAILPVTACADGAYRDTTSCTAMSIFEDLIGKQWEGRFDDPEETIRLYMNWQSIVDGAAVEMNAWFNPPNITRREVYYFDRTKNQVSYLGITSNGYVAAGRAELRDSILTFLGSETFPDRSVHDTKSRWEFLPNGEIRVTGYWLQNGEWKPGHKIVYKAVDSKR